MEQVYAVVYDHAGNILIAVKLNVGYFFWNPATSQGRVLPPNPPANPGGGQTLNGGGNNALPGGGLLPGEPVLTGAAREFSEETAVDLAGMIISQQFKGWPQYYNAGYFLVSPQSLQNILQQITTTNLPQAQQAAADIQGGLIVNYPQIAPWYPNCPKDNELQTMAIWDLNNPATWATIVGWNAPGTGLDWYYNILLHLKQTILHIP